ncbi:Importin-beta N-terminal domain containing protein [Histomonas meleagridis]|nr:Importin-beta N-terminal domain containing protein [Histomonas meleagridis]
MGVPEKIQIGLQLLIFLSDELQAFVDHSVSSKVRAMLRHSFVSLVPQITFQVVNILKDANQNPFPTTVRAFGLLKSFLHWISPNFISPELVEILLNYSRSEVGDIAKEAHDCIFELFSRYDALSVHTVEFRARFLRVVFAFFEYEICLFGTNQVSDAYIKSILHAFQPFAANYFFKQDTFDESIVASFLYNFEQATWKLFGTPHFSMMIEIWGDLLTGKESTYMDPMKYKPHFISLLEHLLDAMISPQLLIHFTEDDNLIVHDVVYEIALCYTFEACKLVHRATATAINNCLPSITALLMCFHNVIRLINDDDPSNETISDSLLRYTNELMTKQLNIDVPQVFAIVQTIIKTYVRKFSRNSLHFVEKVFHLLTVSLSLGPDFIQPMLELLLETVKIHRPMTPCKTLLNRLLEMQNVFSSMPIPIYSLYICCAEIIASFFPTDGGARPLANADVIRQLFSTIFDNLSSPENMPIALQLLRDAVNSIAFSIRATKDLVFSAFVPYIDLIMNIYETNITERAIGPLLDFIASFMTIFPSQIAERMSEFINRLFAPLVSVLPHVADGSFEHYATMSFLKILYQLASFRTAAAALQTINIAKFMVQYTDSLFHGPSIDVLWTCLKIVQILITDRWGLLGEAYQQSLLRILFFDGVCAKDPSSVKISIEAIIEAHKLYQVLDRVDQTFRFNAFSAICNEMCSCSHYMMRDSMVEFAVFFCSMVPDFTDKLLIPFIQQLPIQPMDKEILAKSFCRSFDIDEFRQIFVEFCDDVAYLMGDREE